MVTLKNLNNKEPKRTMSKTDKEDSIIIPIENQDIMIKKTNIKINLVSIMMKIISDIIQKYHKCLKNLNLNLMMLNTRRKLKICKIKPLNSNHSENKRKISIKMEIKGSKNKFKKKRKTLTLPKLA